MTPDDPRHGTTRGFHAGCRERCCRAAISRYQKTIRWNALKGERLSVPSLGAQRRIQALMALGWTGEDIAEAAGLGHRNYVRRILVGQKGLPCTWVERKTHDAIADAFEHLAMRLPPDSPYRRRARTMARNRGYLPPLAWDDIDDPDETPLLGSDRPLKTDIDPVVVERILNGQRITATLAEKREVVRRWDRSLAELERLTGWKAERYAEVRGDVA